MATGDDGQALPKELQTALHVVGPLQLGPAKDEGHDKAFPALALRPGVYRPGIGGGGRRIMFPADVLQLLAPTLTDQPVNIDHSVDAGDVVGLAKNARYEDGVRATLLLQHDRPRFQDALKLTAKRLAMGEIPNVSVEFINPRYRQATDAEKADFDIALASADKIGGIAILMRGACPAPTCGIGLAEHVSLGATWQGTTLPAGADGHVHDVWIEHGKDWQGKLRTTLWTSEHTDPTTNVRHTHAWKNAGETTTDAGHAHKLPALPPELGLAAITVQAPRADGHKDGEPTMCEQHQALQARITALEADKDKEAKDAQLKLKAKAETADDLQKQLDTANAELQDYRKLELQALTEGITELLPDGQTLTALVGDKPSKRDLVVALAALRANAPKGQEKDEDDEQEAPATKLGAGRRSKDAGRDAKGDAAQAAKDQEKLVALRAAHGVGKGYDKMPPKLRGMVDASLQRHESRTARRGGAGTA